MTKNSVSSGKKSTGFQKIITGIKPFFIELRKHPRVLVSFFLIAIVFAGVGFAGGYWKYNQNEVSNVGSRITHYDGSQPLSESKADQLSNSHNEGDSAEVEYRALPVHPLTFSVMNEVKNELIKDNVVSEANLFTDNKGYLWWNVNGYTVVSDKAETISIGVIYDEPDNLSQEDPALARLGSAIENIMLQLGFEKSDEADYSNDFASGYKNSEYACSSVVNGDFDFPEFRFQCAELRDIQVEYQAKKPFLVAANLKNSGIGLLEMNEINDKVLLINGSSGRSGAAYYFYNNNGSWEFIFSGQEMPGCSILSDKNIPKRYWFTCWDDSNNNNDTSKVIEY